MDAHLRRGVDCDRRRNFAAERRHAQILHNKRVHAECRRRPDDVGRLRHFAVGDQRVQRQMHLDAAHMTIDHGLLQFVRGKILRAHTRVECIIAEINGVCAVLNGGAQRLHRTGGG